MQRRLSLSCTTSCTVWISLTCLLFFFFFFNDTATTEIYTLSLHDALPICASAAARSSCSGFRSRSAAPGCRPCRDRKSTRLNSSHSQISYAVFCLKKKKTTQKDSDHASLTDAMRETPPTHRLISLCTHGSR